MINFAGSFLRIRSQGGWALSNDELRTHTTENDYPIDQQKLEWMSLSGDFSADLAKGQRVIAGWMPELMAMKRVARPLRDLFLAQQCGGSDAFSGVSANPLLGKVSCVRALPHCSSRAHLPAAAKAVSPELVQ